MWQWCHCRVVTWCGETFSECNITQPPHTAPSLCQGSSQLTARLIIIVSICCPTCDDVTQQIGSSAFVASIIKYDRNFPPLYFLTGISGQISMLSCLTSSISVATRRTTSPSPPPTLHVISLCVKTRWMPLPLSLRSPYLWFQASSSSLLPRLLQGCARLGS